MNMKSRNSALGFKTDQIAHCQIDLYKKGTQSRSSGRNSQNSAPKSPSVNVMKTMPNISLRHVIGSVFNKVNRGSSLTKNNSKQVSTDFEQENDMSISNVENFVKDRNQINGNDMLKGPSLFLFEHHQKR